MAIGLACGRWLNSCRIAVLNTLALQNRASTPENERNRKFLAKLPMSTRSDTKNVGLSTMQFRLPRSCYSSRWCSPIGLREDVLSFDFFPCNDVEHAEKSRVAVLKIHN
jgi:hypothetical protein